MYDNLSYKQIYDKLELFNHACYDCIYDNDFKSFQTTINNFLESGITKLPDFEIARKYYRFSQIPITINGIWLGKKVEDLLNSYIQNDFGIFGTLEIVKEQDLYIQLTDLNSFISQHGYDEYESEVYEGKNTHKLNRDKRRDAIVQYSNIYKYLYSQNSIFANNPVTHIIDYQKNYIDKIKRLADIRSKFYLTYNFLLFDDAIKINENLKNLSLKEKIDFLSNSLTNVYQNAKVASNHLRNYLKFEKTEHSILFSNYIQGKYMDRKNWKNYYHFKFPKNPIFYLELAFYLCLPSSSEIEKFMNLHGYSLNSDLLCLDQIIANSQTYNIMYKDLKKWIDTGVDYELINEILGYQLEIKEVKKIN